MAGYFLGPMPVEEFLEQFLPESELPSPSLPSNHFSKVPINDTETKMYDPFIKLLKDLIPGFKVVNTGSSPDSNSDPHRKIKPDPTMYKESVDISNGKTKFDKAEMNIEFKRDKSSEPFVDDSQSNGGYPFPFESQTKKGRHVRAQLTDYMAEVFSRQHRIFGFSLFIRDDTARFIRWDRAGVIVSAQFNYHKNSEPLVEFFWRFSHLTDQQRGHDPNVRLAKNAEIKLAEKKLSEWKPKEKRAFVVFTVPGEDKKPREFIAWNPMAAPYTVTGRCTRAYPVYEKATDKCYFLKDLWRAHELEPEADILRKLAEKKVKHVPKFLCGGDIVSEKTKSDIYALDKTAAPWLVGDKWWKITPRVHHRFVVDFIGKPLSTVENSKQLMQVVSDAYTGSQQAYEKCGYVHRDISGRNILIDENGRGVLNDWDLAKPKEQDKKLRRHVRTGTWQFMSYLLLSGHHDVHTIQDDMESFFYVMLYFGLRYLQHNYARRVPYILKHIFDQEDIGNDGSVIGGMNKGSFVLDFTRVLGDDFKFSSPPFQRWFEWSVQATDEWIRHCKQAKRVRVEATQGAESKLFYDHSNMAQVFAECLDSHDWPTDEPRPIDAAAEADGGTTRTSKRPFDSEYVDDDGSIGGSRKQSRTSNPAGSRGGSNSHSKQDNKRSTSRTSGSRNRGSNSQQANEQSTSRMRDTRGGSLGGLNSKHSMQSTSRHSMTTRSRTGSSHGG